MLGPVAAAFGELDDAAPANVGILTGLRDVLAVALDVIEHQAFAQRQIAQRELVGLEPLQDGVEQYGAGNDEVRAARVEPGHLHALADAAMAQLFAKAVNLLG